jgi:hypothetical protein
LVSATAINVELYWASGKNHLKLIKHAVLIKDDLIGPVGAIQYKKDSLV